MLQNVFVQGQCSSSRDEQKQAVPKTGNGFKTTFLPGAESRKPQCKPCLCLRFIRTTLQRRLLNKRELPKKIRPTINAPIRKHAMVYHASHSRAPMLIVKACFTTNSNCNVQVHIAQLTSNLIKFDLFNALIIQLPAPGKGDTPFARGSKRKP